MATKKSTRAGAAGMRPAGRRGNGEGSIYFQASRQRWCGSISLDGGKRKVVYADTRKEVREKLTATLRQKQQGIPFTPDRVRTGAWLDYWLEHVIRAEREPTTYDGYELSVRLHIKPYLGSVHLGKLQPEHIERWLASLEAKGTGRRTQQFALQRLRTALNVALKRGYVARNVAELVEAPRVSKKKLAPPSVEDARRLLEAVRGDRLGALVTVALALGLRRGEALGLQWEDIDLGRRQLTVRHRVNRVRGRGLLVRDGAKTDAGIRTVMLPNLLVQALKRHRVHQLEDRLVAGDRWIGPDYENGAATGFVFTSSIGTVVEPRRVGVFFASARRRAGLDEHTFHGLRHDFASLLLAEGVPLWAVSKLLGHSNIQITANVYGHLLNEQGQDAANRIDALLAGQS